MKRDKVTEAYELGRKHEREMLVECLNKTRVEAIKDYDDYCIDGFLRDFKQSNDLLAYLTPAPLESDKTEVK